MKVANSIKKPKGGGTIIEWLYEICEHFVNRYIKKAYKHLNVIETDGKIVR